MRSRPRSTRTTESNRLPELPDGTVQPGERGAGQVRILGIDPGLTRCGLGVVEVDGRRQASLISVEVARSKTSLATHFRLRDIANAIADSIRQHSPEVVAIERVFTQDNLQSVTPTTQVMGAAMAEVGRAGLPLAVYTPSEVKAAVTGSGRADKAQVQHMVARILRLSGPPRPADAADALAIAICHAWKGTGLLGAGPDGTVEVSLSGKVSAKSELTPAQRRWAQAQANQKRKGAVDPRRRGSSPHNS